MVFGQRKGISIVRDALELVGADETRKFKIAYFSIEGCPIVLARASSGIEVPKTKMGLGKDIIVYRSHQRRLFS